MPALRAEWLGATDARFDLDVEANGHRLSEMDGYFETDARGLKDLLDLDGNGQAELLRQSFDDGYWITSLYEARDRSRSGTGAAPGAERSIRCTRDLRTGLIVYQPRLYRVDTQLKMIYRAESTRMRPAMTLERVEWADVQQSGDPMLRFSNGRECEMAGWYSSAAGNHRRSWRQINSNIRCSSRG